MMRSGGREAPDGAWLGILAVLLQLFLPVLVISDAAMAAGAPCPFRADVAATAPGDAATSAELHDRGQNNPAADVPYRAKLACCAVCTAVHVAHASTAPRMLVIAAPRIHREGAWRSPDQAAVASTYAASYSSRAPPSIG
jgi:hypothetical protein